MHANAHAPAAGLQAASRLSRLIAGGGGGRRGAGAGPGGGEGGGGGVAAWTARFRDGSARAHGAGGPVAL
jgi:hypothetical protein